LALFGRRSPQRVDSLVMPASENLHNNGLMQLQQDALVFGFALEAMAAGSVQ
jgi:hypothetical protein